jgi:hypothetical protein
MTSRAETPLSLSVVIPAYNEAGRLEPTVRSIASWLEGRGRSFEIIVVDDGSHDGTHDLVARLSSEIEHVRGIRLPENRGKGCAVRTGVMNATGERVLFADADGATPIQEIERLDAALDAGAHGAIGSRELATGGVRTEVRFYRRALGRAFHALVSTIAVRGYRDTQCGFKLFRREIAHDLFARLKSDGFSFDVELLLLARKLDYVIREVPVNWTHQPGSRINLVTDSVRMAIDLFAIRARLAAGPPPVVADTSAAARTPRRLREALPFIALAGAVGLLILATFRDYGITFDESVQAAYGEHIIAWYKSLFRDRDVLTFSNLEYYGGFFDVIAQTARRFSPFGQYETRHLVNALFGMAGLWATWRIGMLLGGRRAGFLAALFLVTTPVWYGHSFNNPKDIPFATLYLITLYYILLAVARFPRLNASLVMKLGIALGLTLAIRFGGILLFGYLGFAFVGWLLWRRLSGDRALAGAIAPFALRAAAVLAIAWTVMLLWWPAAQVAPFRQPLRTLGALSSFDWDYNVLFGGEFVRATELPWVYLPTWFALTMPEFMLGGALAALLFGLVALIRQSSDGLLVLRWATLVFAVMFPAAWAIGTDAVLYDGLRHFLFAVPVLAIVAGAGVDRLLRAGKPVRVLTVATVGLAMVFTIVDMIRLHPNQYIWFNRVVAGGVEKAALSYETDYWGNAYKEAAEWIAVTFGDTPEPIRIASCSQRMSVRYYLDGSRFRLVGRRESPDLFLGSKRFGCQDQIEGEIIHTVQRMNTPLVVIKRVSGSRKAAEAAQADTGGPATPRRNSDGRSSQRPRKVAVARRHRLAILWPANVSLKHIPGGRT